MSEFIYVPRIEQLSVQVDGMIYYLHCFYKQVKKTITDNNAQYKILADTYRKRVMFDVDGLVWYGQSLPITCFFSERV